MYENSMMLKFGLAITLLMLAAMPARAEGGGGTATPQQMPDICKSQAASLKLSADATDAFIQKCTSASSNTERKGAMRMEGTK